MITNSNLKTWGNPCTVNIPTDCLLSGVLATKSQSGRKKVTKSGLQLHMFFNMSNMEAARFAARRRNYRGVKRDDPSDFIVN